MAKNTGLDTSMKESGQPPPDPPRPLTHTHKHTGPLSHLLGVTVCATLVTLNLLEAFQAFPSSLSLSVSLTSQVFYLIIPNLAQISSRLSCALLFILNVLPKQYSSNKYNITCY